MRFTSLLAAGAALVAGALAQVQFTNSVFGTLLAGQPFTLTWSEATGPVTITLKNGPSSNLQTVTTIASGLTGTSFVWTPPKSTADGSYALEITDGKTTNYSPQFVLGGGSASAAPTASGSTASASATGSSSLPNISSASSASASASSASKTTLSKSSSTASASSSASSASKSGASSSASAASKTSSSTASSTSSTPTTTTHPPDSAAAGLASPLAFVLLAVAALITLN